MAEVDGVKASLVQTQALERVQESARRHGDLQQQSFAASLNHQVDAREHQVIPTDEAQPEELDPEARKKREEALRRHLAGEPEQDENPEDGEENLGRHVDVRA